MTQGDEAKNYDLLIVGAGMAGSILAARIAEKGVHPGSGDRLKVGLLEWGIRVEEVLTDNGSCYVSHAFQGLCQQLGLRHIRTRPYRPQTNGKAERLIQTLLVSGPTASPTLVQATVFAGFAPGFTSIIITGNIKAWVACLLSADFPF